MRSVLPQGPYLAITNGAEGPPQMVNSIVEVVRGGITTYGRRHGPPSTECVELT